MKILFLGFSNFVQNRVLPFLPAANIFSEFAIASRSGDAQVMTSLGATRVYSDYLEALQDFKPDFVYISLVNNLHAEWVEHSLESGAHTIVDKPAVGSLEKAEALLELAANRGLCLAEGLIYTAHPQIEKLTSEFRQAGVSPEKISTTFSFPPFAPENFRNDPALGGGAIEDLGPYAVSIGRLIFGGQPQQFHAAVTGRHPDTGVVTGFSLLLIYPSDRTLVGNFSFETEYRNQLTVFGRGLTVELDRIYTTPDNFENTLRVQRQGEQRQVAVSAANSAILFLQQCVGAVKAGDWTIYSRTMLEDADALQHLRQLTR